MVSKDNQVHIKNSTSQPIYVYVAPHPSWAIADSVVGAACESLKSISGGVDGAALGEVVAALLQMTQDIINITSNDIVEAAQSKLKKFKALDGTRKVNKGAVELVLKLDLLNANFASPSFYAAVSGGDDVMIIVVTDDGKKSIAFPSNSDHSWIVESGRIVRAKYGTTGTPDPDSGNFPFAGSGGCIVYEDSSYKGKFMVLPEGSWTNKQIWNLSNNSITSLRIMPGFKVELFADDDCKNLLCDFDNRNHTTVMKDACLNKTNNDETTSVRVTRKK